MKEENKSGEGEVEVSQPIILDLGKQTRKRIKRLKKGRGKLWFEVENVIVEVSTSFSDEPGGKIIVPIILVYRRKPKRSRGLRMLGLR